MGGFLYKGQTPNILRRKMGFFFLIGIKSRLYSDDLQIHFFRNGCGLKVCCLFVEVYLHPPTIYIYTHTHTHLTSAHIINGPKI